MSSRKKTFFMGALLMSAVNLSMRTVSLYFSAFVLSRVGEEGIGLFTLLMNVFSFAITLASAGIGLAVTTSVASEIDTNAPHRQTRIVRTALTYSATLATFVMLALLLLARPISSLFVGDSRVVGALSILAFSLLPMVCATVFSGYFVALRRVPLSAGVQVLTQLLKILLTILFLPAGEALPITASLERLAWACVLSETLGALLLLLFSLRILPKKKEKQDDFRPLRPLLRTTIPLAVSATIRQALLTLEHSLIPKRLLKYEGSTMESALADYGTLHGMALPLLLYPLSPLSSFSSLLVPEFAELKSTGDRERMGSIASRALAYTVSYASVICVFLFVFSEELSCLIYKNSNACVHLFVLAPIVPLMYLDHVTDAILKGIGEHVYSMWVNITDSLLSIALLYFLLPRLGILGYAVVIIVMEGYNFLLSLCRLRRRIPINFSHSRNLLFPLFCAIVAALLTSRLFLLNGSTTPYLFFFLKSIFFLAIFLVLFHSRNFFRSGRLSGKTLNS